MKRLALLALLVCAAGCIDDPSSPRVVCDDLRDAFSAKSEDLGCGIAMSYRCSAIGSGATCDATEVAYCRAAIDDATDCRYLMSAGPCVLHCDGV